MEQSTVLLAQTNDWYRGPNEWVQNSDYRSSSQRRKGATRHIVDMVWLYRSPFSSVGRRSYSCSYECYLPSRRLEVLWLLACRYNLYYKDFASISPLLCTYVLDWCLCSRSSFMCFCRYFFLVIKWHFQKFERGKNIHEFLAFKRPSNQNKLELRHQRLMIDC